MKVSFPVLWSAGSHSRTLTSQKQTTGYITRIWQHTPSSLLTYSAFLNFSSALCPWSFLQCLCLMMFSAWPFQTSMQEMLLSANVTVSYMQERKVSHRRDVCLSKTLQVGCAALLTCRSPSYLWSHYELLYTLINSETRHFKHWLVFLLTLWQSNP